MSTHLQLVVSKKELEELKAIAQEEGLTVSEWVRRAVRTARSYRPKQNQATKLRAMQNIARYNTPTADVEQILTEIDAGRVLSGSTE